MLVIYWKKSGMIPQAIFFSSSSEILNHFQCICAIDLGNAFVWGNMRKRNRKHWPTASKTAKEPLGWLYHFIYIFVWFMCPVFCISIVMLWYHKTPRKIPQPREHSNKVLFSMTQTCKECGIWCVCVRLPVLSNLRLHNMMMNNIQGGILRNWNVLKWRV